MEQIRLSQDVMQTLRQEQVMAPHQIQALEILMATVQELDQRISHELETNPVLELVAPGSEDLVGNPVENDDQEADDNNAGGGQENGNRDDLLAAIVDLSRTHRDTPQHNQESLSDLHSEEGQERRKHLFDSLVAAQSFQEQLQTQLSQLAPEMEAQKRELCEHIIGCIDDDGFLRVNPADIAIVANADMKDVRTCIRLIQNQFDPPGVGACDIRECLLLQLERRGDKASLAYQAIDQHFDDLLHNRIPQVAKALRVSKTQVYAILDEIRTLSPRPGLAADESRPEFVYPEAFIEKDGQGNWQVRVNHEFIPQVRISPFYLKLLENPDTPRETRAYIREKITGSKLLLRAIEQRQSTIERIARSLLKFQRDFFENGVSGMKPLVMNQVAEDLGVHETTISRAISHKYVQTPHGLFPFKHFFSTGYSAETGDTVSSHAIRKLLRDLVDTEDSHAPLSDQKLMELLKEKGLHVARRTIAKYREELSIPPSHIRRSF